MDDGEIKMISLASEIKIAAVSEWVAVELIGTTYRIQADYEI